MSDVAVPKKTGPKPSITPEIGDEICGLLAEGRSLREVCRNGKFPHEATVRGWALSNEEFGTKYRAARELGYHSMLDEMLEIADDGSNDWMQRKIGDEMIDVENKEVINRSRLRVDTRKWTLAKALPKIYGDKIVQEHVGPDGGPIQTEEKSDGDLAKALMALFHRAKD